MPLPEYREVPRLLAEKFNGQGDGQDASPEGRNGHPVPKSSPGPVDVLDAIESRIDHVKREIAALQGQLSVLEQAAELLRPVYRAIGPLVGPPRRDLAGLTILEAARRILGESPGIFVDYGEIAREAMNRGYRSSSGRNPESDPTKIVNSFNVVMRRNPFIFEKQGRRFRIKPTDQTIPTEET